MFRGIGWPCSVSFTSTFFFAATFPSAVPLALDFAGISFDVPEGFAAFVGFAPSGDFADDCDGFSGSGDGLIRL